MHRGCVAGFPVDCAGENQGPVAKLAGLAGSGLEREPTASNHKVLHVAEDGIVWLRGFRRLARRAEFEIAAHRARDAAREVELRKNSQGILKSRGIGRSRP